MTPFTMSIGLLGSSVSLKYTSFISKLQLADSFPEFDDSGAAQKLKARAEMSAMEMANFPRLSKLDMMMLIHGILKFFLQSPKVITGLVPILFAPMVLSTGFRNFTLVLSTIMCTAAAPLARGEIVGSKPSEVR